MQATSSTRPAGVRYGAKVPTKFVPGQTRTLRTVNPIDGSLVRVETNPRFDGGLPGGADWDPADLALPKRRPESYQAHVVTSCAIGDGLRDRAGSGPRLYQGHLHYSDADRRAMRGPMVGFPPAPKTAGVPTGLPPQMRSKPSRRALSDDAEPTAAVDDGKHRYDDGAGDPASIIARTELAASRRVSAGLLAKEAAGTSRATASLALRPSSREGHFVTSSRHAQLGAYVGARERGMFDPATRNAERLDPWTNAKHVIMEGTTMSADAPSWFHVPHVTVCNMTRRQVESLKADNAPVPTHLVPPDILREYGMKPPTPASPRSRPSTTASEVRATLAKGTGSYSRPQLARKMIGATKAVYEAAAGGQGIRPRTSTPGGTRRMANTADRRAVNAEFGTRVGF